MASGYSDLSEIRKNRTYAQYHRPAKINLLNERPRRESLIEQQLATNLTRPDISSSVDQSSESWFQGSHQQPATSGADYSRSPSAGLGAPSIYNATSSNTQGTRARETGTSSSLYGGNQFRGPASSLLGQSLVELESDLAQKEARLKREIAHLNQQLSPWARPRQIREPRREPEPRSSRSQQRWIKECPSPSPSSRPTSRASSTKSNVEAELLDKASKLVQTAEELERKPLKTQMILIEDGARRRMQSPTQTQPSISSVHTAVIKVPNHEVDNKSPLPVAFDNFSTLGVRGNLASLGAAPPESPYPPIFPVVKRTPSPNVNHR